MEKEPRLTFTPELRSRLTPRRVEVMEQVANGMTYKEVAGASGVTRDTVKNLVENGLNGIDDLLDGNRGYRTWVSQLIRRRMIVITENGENG